MFYIKVSKERSRSTDVVSVYRKLKHCHIYQAILLAAGSLSRDTASTTCKLKRANHIVQTPSFPTFRSFPDDAYDVIHQREAFPHLLHE